MTIASDMDKTTKLQSVTTERQMVKDDIKPTQSPIVELDRLLLVKEATETPPSVVLARLAARLEHGDNSDKTTGFGTMVIGVIVIASVVGCMVVFIVGIVVTEVRKYSQKILAR